MATRFAPGTAGESTEFQIHKTLHPEYSLARKKLVDFTEHKLIRYANSVDDRQQSEVIFDIIDKYRRGIIAVAWKRGRPVYVDLTKEK